ncbi:hypothetical protein EYF80_010325 [Liparis tanakae]|uniref:Uncharacterized protein n=1 Tax=Liparis tanakae TaxID=230148 RepID=A0A4Z2IPB5_9TELE|nr:hypothetical protein EYF80_010325 [Liparis tanakae]
MQVDEAGKGKTKCEHKIELQYHMLPVMSSAPSGRLRALSAYSLRVPECLLTVNSVEGVGIFFVGRLWSTDDLQHGALRLRAPASSLRSSLSSPFVLAPPPLVLRDPSKETNSKKLDSLGTWPSFASRSDLEVVMD